ncbi:DUF302 domain-containing protein [Cryobacterium sp. TMT2-17-1]|uniref:DUF302 domain-containing protein n=1 Tax=Cryobacterium sandaracinum TaxID=1259247 RepID=A0ABY2JCG3_9MICO|nr:MULTISPECIES: DUF302 domain-containing protein [Cryobacterium]TFB61299.1 DUF302 domain-containing protein [Cryobacterium sp. Sr3]TFB62991.1 DUF302 domain-containing protein [Cryobacterium sp. Hz7]TFC51977.1 DUF302 domain-containing protein [Cryobacterium sp. TMT2-17-1]TFC65468.1 DUF302 domain-containing protein [Cryobacterium sp. TMT2-4]TFD02648.1 DUF302 domain-containing protein [Cryobacterium sandaracinum]
MSYAHTVTVNVSFDEAVRMAREALADQGFGILTEIDIQSTFAAKLGQEAADAVGDYLILGACNPALAQRAVTADPGIGALLPCNVVVRRHAGAGETTVEALDPAIMAQLSTKPEIEQVSIEADARLRAALAAVLAGATQ